MRGARGTRRQLSDQVAEMEGVASRKTVPQQPGRGATGLSNARPDTAVKVYLRREETGRTSLCVEPAACTVSGPPRVAGSPERKDSFPGEGGNTLLRRKPSLSAQLSSCPADLSLAGLLTVRLSLTITLSPNVCAHACQRQHLCGHVQEQCSYETEFLV